MKKYYALIPLILFSALAGAEIRNGYENEVETAQLSLRSLFILQADKQLNGLEKRKVKTNIARLVSFLTYYELTEHLLQEFRTIAPDLYTQLDTIRDFNGNNTDIYVKFIPSEEATIQSAGITCIAQSDENEHRTASEYGPGTVSVKIWVFPFALHALSHELGHINFVVPNLAQYTQYYRTNYRENVVPTACLGHKLDDRSGRTAYAFERRFSRYYASHLKSSKGRIESPMERLASIRKKILAEKEVFLASL